MPRIRMLDKIYNRCSKLIATRTINRTLVKELEGINIKHGDIVKCINPTFRKYTCGKVIGILSKRGAWEELALVYIPNMEEGDEVIWGSNVLSLEPKYFEKV